MFDETSINQLRGSTVVDQDGDKVGRVEQVYLDDTSQRPTWVTVSTGLFGTRETFVPLDRATWEDDTLRVPYEKSFIKNAPNLESDGHLEPSEEDELYRFYGIGGNGGETARRGVIDRDVTGRDRDATDRDRDVTGRDLTDRGVPGQGLRDRDLGDRDTEAATTLHEERVNVDTDRREAGRARLRKYVVTDTESVEVPVQREELRVDREPVSGESARPGGQQGDRRHRARAGRQGDGDGHRACHHRRLPGGGRRRPGCR
jgi:sporulation protein YlmC with PRC-barrel domain